MDLNRTLLGDSTRCVHGAQAHVSPRPGDPIAPPLVFAAPYHLGTEHYYGADSNLTLTALEGALGDLDGGHCVSFGSGMAAIAALLRTVLRSGDVLVLPSDGYYWVRRYAQGELADFGVTVRLLPTAAALTQGDVAEARLVLLETPSNPGLEVCDIAALAELVHAAGGLLAVDNTTATPLGQRPLELGADITVCSDTKAVAGHSDVLLGHVSTLDAELASRVRAARRGGSSVPGPMEAWLALRGLSTLDLRLTRQRENAAAVVAALRDHPGVTGLRWPGDPRDPAHPVAGRQMRRFSGVLRFVLADEAAVQRFLGRCALVASATSFGGVHSTADRRAQWGDAVPAGFVRLSCGIEDSEDLVADLLAALGTG
ncbi:MAG: cystathionine gamma-lyase [Sciscionella sp.]